jgi:hypothetical protein
LRPRRPGSYEGVIAGVTEERVRNRYTARREWQPVIDFADGWRLIPNLSMREALINIFGPETDAWHGRRITITRSRRETTNQSSGEVRVRWVKSVSCADKHARAADSPPVLERRRR